MSCDPIREEARQRLKAMAEAAFRRGDPTGWFEELYAGAAGDESQIPWARRAEADWLMEWLERGQVRGGGRRALVVGCGLGNHAAQLQERGFDVTAFDIAPSAVEWCRKRWLGRPITFEQGDLLAPPQKWRRAFDFVFEANTLQTLRGDLRTRAVRNVAEFVRGGGGELLVICRARDEQDPEGDLPWPLTRADLSGLTAGGLNEVVFEDYIDKEDPPVRRFRAHYRRA
jgi:SAM-dependent methyltransferase